MDRDINRGTHKVRPTGAVARQRTAFAQAGGAFSSRISKLQASAGAPGKLALPRQRVRDDGLQIVKARLPSERGADLVAGGDDLCRVARPPRRDLDLEVGARHALDGLDHFQHGKAAAVTAIERRGGAARAQIRRALRNARRRGHRRGYSRGYRYRPASGSRRRRRRFSAAARARSRPRP